MVMLAAIAVSITVGLAACGSSDASSTPTTPATAPAATTSVATQPAVTVPATTSPAAAAPATTVAPAATTAVPTTDAAATVSDAEVADMEKQLDEIDQLLAGVDSDLSQD